MANEVARRTAQASALAHAADPGAGADISTIDFTAKALHFNDLPATFPTGNALVPAGPNQQTPEPTDTRRPGEELLAHVTRQHPKPFRLQDGTVVQRRTGWAVYPSRIVTVTAERPLTKTDTGAYRPIGNWNMVRRETATVEGRADRTVGNVPIDPADSTTSDGTPTQQHPTANTEATRFPEGANALTYLPAPVRRSLYARIPEPTMFDGKAVQYIDNGTYEVAVLRRSGRTAVVAIGELPPASPTWKVTMLTYTFTQPPTIEGRGGR